MRNAAVNNHYLIQRPLASALCEAVSAIPAHITIIVKSGMKVISILLCTFLIFMEIASSCLYSAHKKFYVICSSDTYNTRTEY